MGYSKRDVLCRSSEKPSHQVNVTSFKMGKYEVSFAQYDLFAKATGRELPSDRRWGRKSRPVININWDAAQAYVQWLSQQTGLRFRLPSEAEWEYAARAGTTTTFNWDVDPFGVARRIAPIATMAFLNPLQSAAFRRMSLVYSTCTATHGSG